MTAMAARHDPATCTTCRLLGGPAWCPNRIAAARHSRWCRYCHGAGEYTAEYSPDVGEIREPCPELEAEAEQVAARDPRVAAAMAAAVDRWRNSPPPPAVTCPWCATGDCDETHQETP